jgi:hypothetical protein
MNRDIANNLLIVKAFDSNFTINETKVGVGIDTAQYNNGVMFACIAYSYTDGDFAITMQHSPDNSVFTDVPAEKLNGSIPVINSETAEAAEAYKIGAFSTDRWIRFSVTSTSVTTGGSIKIYAIKKAQNRPI